jgi:hypothetical protein
VKDNAALGVKGRGLASWGVAPPSARLRVRENKVIERQGLGRLDVTRPRPAVTSIHSPRQDRA